MREGGKGLVYHHLLALSVLSEAKNRIGSSVASDQYPADIYNFNNRQLGKYPYLTPQSVKQCYSVNFFTKVGLTQHLKSKSFVLITSSEKKSFSSTGLAHFTTNFLVAISAHNTALVL